MFNFMLNNNKQSAVKLAGLLSSYPCTDIVLQPQKLVMRSHDENIKITV